MKILNLANPNKSDIKFRVIYFQDEVSLNIVSELNHKIDFIKIYTRINNANDLFLLTQACDILNRHGLVYDLYITYLMSMRMDRVVDFNKPFSLKIVANIIKSCGARDIYVLEPHSERVHIELGSKPIYNPIDMIRKVAFGEDSRYSTKVIVFPNASAKERYNTGSIDNTVVCFNNDYNLKNDKISISVELENKNDIYYLNKCSEITVYDYLCDDGEIFVLIADYIRKINNNCKLNIVLTHVIDQNGIKNLCDKYDNITITNSYANWSSSEKMKVIEVI